jgi:superfamily II DNA helicase RecQ
MVFLPTNTRKSFSYFLASSLSISKVTIVIIPLVGLKNNILKHATNKFNIPCSIYDDTKKF